MAPRLEELQVEEEPFIAFLKLAFAQKRKTLVNNLRGQYDAGRDSRGVEDCRPALRRARRSHAAGEDAPRCSARCKQA